MISLTVARRYARAFLEIGLKERNNEILGEELRNFAELLRENQELRQILYSSVYPSPMRKGIVQALARALQLSPRTREFIELLIDRERINHFFEILKSYEDLYNEILNQERATLLTPFDLPFDLVETIRSKLEEKTGKKIIISLEKDPSLIGGVVIKIGNTIYDGSLWHQLLKIRDNLYKE